MFTKILYYKGDSLTQTQGFIQLTQNLSSQILWNLNFNN